MPRNLRIAGSHVWSDGVAIAMQTNGVAAAYDRWAPIYDLVFGPVFRQGRSDAIRVADAIGGRILEVGVGTGITRHFSLAGKVTNSAR